MPRREALDGSLKSLLAGFLEFIALNRNQSPHTVRAYESDLTQFIGWAATASGRKRAELTPADLSLANLRGFLAELHARGISRASVARKLSAARAFARHLRREGALDDDPAALLGAPKLDRKIPRHLDVSEMERLLETPDTSHPLGRRDRAILELFYASGLRLSELVGLDLDSINLPGRMVRVLGKGRKERIVPFNRSTADALHAWLRDREVVASGAFLQSLRERRRAGTDRAEPAPEPRPAAHDPAASAKRSRQSARPALFLNYRGGRFDRPQRAPARRALRRAMQRAIRHQPARAPAFVRNPPAASRRRPARDSGVARTRQPEHHAALHARERGVPDGRVQEVASQGLMELRATSYELRARSEKLRRATNDEQDQDAFSSSLVARNS